MRNLVLWALERLGLLRPAFRSYEGLAALRAGRRAPERGDDGLPVPPPRLIVRVAGTADVDWFLESGRLAAASIRAALERHGTQVEALGSLLDFGCGCGRVTRRWARLDGTAVAGSDMNERAIAWCRRNLCFAHFETNELGPPLAFGTASFDLVYALSVFTHLTEELQHAWMRELERVLRPGGLLLLSTHGERYLPRLTNGERNRFRAGEVVVRRPAVVGTNLCAAYHPPSYVRERLATALEPLDFVPEGATGNPHQDLFLFCKRAYD